MEKRGRIAITPRRFLIKFLYVLAPFAIAIIITEYGALAWEPIEIGIMILIVGLLILWNLRYFFIHFIKVNIRKNVTYLRKNKYKE